MYRQHQQQLVEILSGDIPRRIIAAVTPGGGKSQLPVLCVQHLIPRFASRICWVVPRRSLQHQAEEAFYNPLNIHLLSRIRTSTNDSDPCRGLAGFVTTYNALAMSNSVVVDEFRKHRYILVLDESQHIADSTSFFNGVAPLVDMAELTLFMSGTLERNKGRKIAFMMYTPSLISKDDSLHLEDTALTRVISYTRTDALREKAIIPIRFTYLDAKAEFKIEAKTVKLETLKSGTKRMRKAALFTALSTDYALHLLDECVSDWRAWKHEHPRSKLLVIAPGQRHARKFVAHLSKIGLCANLAITDEGPRCDRAIRNFKRITGSTENDILVTVGVGYEGLDVRSITHIACLTRIRSKPWIEQMLARATRYDPDAGAWESQEARCFVPDDLEMADILDVIKKEQAPFVSSRKNASRSIDTCVPLEQGTLFPGLECVGSAAAGRRAEPSRAIKSAPVASAPAILTPSDLEDAARAGIENHVRHYASRKRIQIRDVNRILFQRFGKRANMRLTELQAAMKWVQGNLK